MHPRRSPSSEERFPGVGGCVANSDRGRELRVILDRVGDKWSVLIIVTLGRAPMRFGQLHRAVGGISQRMLTLTLRQLERDGLVSRTVQSQVPLRVDYALTPLGATLIEPLGMLAEWTVQHYPDIEKHQARFDERPSSN